MELADLYSMSEEAACFRYNVDNKVEAVCILHEELQSLYKEMDELQEAEDAENWDMPGFRNEVDYCNWKGVR